MEDNIENTGFLPSIGNLYDGDSAIEVDPRYSKGNVLAAFSKGSSISAADPFSHLSAELNTDKYRIRSPEQQEKWTRTKTENTKGLTKCLLRMKCVMHSLLTEIESQPPKLFGKFVLIEGKTAIQYDDSFCDLMAAQVEAYIQGKGDMDIVALSEMLVDEYNLSYANFAKKESLALMVEFDALKKRYDKAASELPKGSQISMLGYEDPLSKIVHRFEVKAGLDWATICVLMRRVKVLHTSAEMFKERLVSTNLRMGLRSAITHFHECGGRKNINFDEKDLLNEAALGLMHAADMFVHGTSARFTTYAEHWINLKVTRYAKGNNPVRVPVHVSDLVFAAVRLMREHESLNSSAPPLLKEDVEVKLSKKISDSMWTLAKNKYAGKSLSMSCVTTNGDEETASFDVFVGGIDGAAENERKLNTNAIMHKIEHELYDKNATRKNKTKLTHEQFVFFKMSIFNGLSNKEIAETYGGGPGGVSENGKLLDAKYVRTELARALEKIRKSLGVKL
jgi:RNA polymerase sigma factor (sigma-70 family)